MKDKDEEHQKEEKKPERQEKHKMEGGMTMRGVSRPMAEMNLQ